MKQTVDSNTIAEKQRWASYRKINTNMPDVRINELNKTIAMVNPQPNERIFEAGSGSGYLTQHLAGQTAPYASVLTSDISPEGIKELERKNKVWKLPITTLLISSDYLSKKKRFDSFSNSFDKVASLATFHHFDNRSINTGTRGRINLLQKIFGLLKPGGTLSIADVANNTNAQRYFDYNDNPIHFHPTGHPHDFMEPEELEHTLKNIGFKDIAISVQDVPWQFKSKDAAMCFIHNLHNAQCTPEESFDIAQEILGFKKIKNKQYELGWQLFFLKAHKN